MVKKNHFIFFLLVSIYIYIYIYKRRFIFFDETKATKKKKKFPSLSPTEFVYRFRALIIKAVGIPIFQCAREIESEGILELVVSWGRRGIYELQAQNLGRAAKRLKESDLVRASNQNFPIELMVLLFHL
ncbi:hypothetical protein LguiA_004619 [Lonicera macranthoides]